MEWVPEMAAVLMLNKIQIGFRTCCPYFHPFKWSLPYSWLHVVSSYQDFINNKQSKRKHKLWKQVSLSLSVTSLHLRSRNGFFFFFYIPKKHHRTLLETTWRFSLNISSPQIFTNNHQCFCIYKWHLMSFRYIPTLVCLNSQYFKTIDILPRVKLLDLDHDEKDVKCLKEYILTGSKCRTVFQLFLTLITQYDVWGKKLIFCGS